jgi:hypothetical protein
MSNDNESAYKCYKRVFDICPEMLAEPKSLLSFSTICQQVCKSNEIVPILKKFVDTNLLNPNTPEILLVLATICMEETKDYKMAYECYQKISNYQGPITPQIMKLKELSNKNMKIAFALYEKGDDGQLKTAPIQQPTYWSIKQLAFISLGLVMILCGIIFEFIINRKNKT